MTFRAHGGAAVIDSGAASAVRRLRIAGECMDGDLFEELFGRRLRFAVDLPAEAMSPRGLAKEGDQMVHPTLAPKHGRERRMAKTRA